jgi:hypothetical protein
MLTTTELECMPRKYQVKTECPDGTKYRIYKDKNEMYQLEYRNDNKPIMGLYGYAKGKWLYLDSQPNYADVVAFMVDEIANIDATE